jgi:hypothetical protein
MALAELRRNGKNGSVAHRRAAEAARPAFPAGPPCSGAGVRWQASAGTRGSGGLDRRETAASAPAAVNTSSDAWIADVRQAERAEGAP